MKELFYLITLIIFIGCKDSESIETKLPEQNIVPKEISKEDRQSNNLVKEKPSCQNNILDFMLLKDEELQNHFFSQLDSIKKVQYPNNDQEDSIFIDMTPEYLHHFLSSINIDTLKKNNIFTLDYYFKRSPEGYSDPEKCKDKIQISFDEKYCILKLNISNTFLAEPDWCGESTVVYGFKIKNYKIIGLWRGMAG